MMEVKHLNNGAEGYTRLVEDDRDRAGLRRRLARALGDSLLAYCVMDTHATSSPKGQARSCYRGSTAPSART